MRLAVGEWLLPPPAFISGKMTDKPKQCDICGNSTYALQLFSETGPNIQMTRFELAALFGDKVLWGCKLCIMKLEAAQIAKDWKLLPPGPFREAFEAEQERRAKEKADGVSQGKGK